jgi:hypothetical protein
MATFRIRPGLRNSDPNPQSSRSLTVRFGARRRARHRAISCCLSRRFSAIAARTRLITRRCIASTADCSRRASAGRRPDRRGRATHSSRPSSISSRAILGSADLAALQGHRHLKGPSVLCSDDGSPLTQRDVQGLVRRAARRANLANIGVTSFVTRLLASGDAWSARTGYPRPGRTSRPYDDAAVHAGTCTSPQPRSKVRFDCSTVAIAWQRRSPLTLTDGRKRRRLVAGAGFEPFVTCSSKLAMARDFWSKGLVSRDLRSSSPCSRVLGRLPQSPAVVETCWRRWSALE